MTYAAYEVGGIVHARKPGREEGRKGQESRKNGGANVALAACLGVRVGQSPACGGTGRK